MDALTKILSLSASEKAARGLSHTPAEIAQQPDTWLVTSALFESRRSEIVEFLSAAGLDAASASRPTIFLIGAGTSDYIGQCLAHLLRKCWQREVIPVPSTDLLTHMDDWLIPGKKYIWISFSRSGESSEGVAVLERARKHHPDIRHLIISCNKDSTMIRGSLRQPHTLAIPLADAVNDNGLAMTSSFSNMLVFGQCLAHMNNFGAYEQLLPTVAEAGRQFLPQAAESASALAEGGFTKACFVGSGPLRAVARECALKLLEMTAGQTPTMSESVLGLRHGPMAALDEDTLFVCFLSSDERIQRYERDLLGEIGNKQLVRCRVAIGGAAMPARGSFSEYSVPFASTVSVADDYRPAVDVFFGQLLGLFFSLRWDLKPDCPSPNGAISRVVQNLSIHA